MKFLPTRNRKRPSSRRFAWALLSLTFMLTTDQCLWALDPHKQMGQYGHDSWTAQRGLSGESVYQILQTKDGYLWVRTSSGLSRFDGVRFVSVDADLGSEAAKAICMSADGDLLIRTSTRTITYKNGHFTNYLPPAPLPDGDTRTLFESREHQLLLGADSALYRIEKDGKALTLRHNTAFINSFLEDSSGKVWIGASSAVFAYQNGRLSNPFNLTSYGFGTLAMTEDRRNRIWAGTVDGLYRLDPGSPAFQPVREIPESVTAVLEDREGNIWAGTGSQGLFRLVNGEITSLSISSGLTDNNILSLLEDREGSLWIGTASGLDRLRDTSLTTFTTKEGLLSNNVHTLLETRDGSLYAFCSGLARGGSVVRIRGDHVMPFEHNAQLPSPFGDALFQSRDGSLWMGTIGGLSRLKDGKLTVYSGDGHFKNGFISAISEDKESLIVANTESKAMRFIGGKVQPFTLRGQPTPFTVHGKYIFAMYIDPAGTLWFGTASGLYKMVPGQPMQPGPLPGMDFAVTSIFDDGAGHLWLGGRTPGLTQYRVRDGRVTSYAKTAGLFDSYVSHILPDDLGNLWVSTQGGIYRISRTALEDFADGVSPSVPSQLFGIADGMKTATASAAAAQPSGARTRDGRLWFATIKGIVVLDPKHLLHNSLVPPVLVESVLADGVDQPFQSEINIRPGARSVEFNYTALTYLVPERVHFKYQLEGYDQGWVDAGPRRTAYYTNLAPAHYRFRVIASNNDGVWNLEGATVAVYIRPRFYQTLWFDAACIVVVVLLLVLGQRRNTRLIRERATQLSRVVTERTAELEKSRRELEVIAHFDALTTLPNRRMFTDTFELMREHTRRQGDGFSMLLIDFDKFKHINDTFGHDAGDAFLIEAAMRLRAAVRSADCVARLGGDEFGILLTGDQLDLERVCDRIVRSFASAIPFKNVELVTTASVGVATFPEHGETQEALYKAADLALYEVKRRGKNAWRRYSPGTQPAVVPSCEEVSI